MKLTKEQGGKTVATMELPAMAVLAMAQAIQMNLREQVESAPNVIVPMVVAAQVGALLVLAEVGLQKLGMHSPEAFKAWCLKLAEPGEVLKEASTEVAPTQAKAAA